MDNSILKKYVCTTPFTYLELHKNGVHSCCPSWLPNKVGSLENINDIWRSEELHEVQESIIDGTYKFCSKTQCPYLSQLINEGVKHSVLKYLKINFFVYILKRQRIFNNEQGPYHLVKL